MGHNASQSSSTIFRFDRFEANRDSYQLRCGDAAVKLERIPLELLFLLLQCQGNVVERERIVAHLWRDESFLDTERSINTAVRKIRKALGDDARRPKFVETVVGKGYRFNAPVYAAAKNQGQGLQRDGQPRNTREVRLRGFSIETTGIGTVLSCEVVVGRIDLGRLPLAVVELPEEVTLPMQPKDRLLVQFHGIRLALTAQAIHALTSVSIAALQSGLRTRETDLP